MNKKTQSLIMRSWQGSKSFSRLGYPTVGFFQRIWIQIFGQMNKTTIETTVHEMIELDTESYHYTKLGDFYLTRIIRAANELGLQGKKITEIQGRRNKFSDVKYIDLITK